MAANKFRDPISPSVRARQNRLVVQVPFEVDRQCIRGFVATGAVFLQTFHDNPVQIAAHQMNQLWRFGLTIAGHRRQIIRHHRAKPRGRTNGIFLPNRPPHFVQPGRQQVLLGKRRLAREQFVEQHAQTVDVAASVHFHARQHGLLGAHVSRRADELLERGEERLIGEPTLRRFCDAEINHPGDSHVVIHGY